MKIQKKKSISLNKQIEDSNSIVIKIGSALLFNKKTNRTNDEWVKSLVDDIYRLHEFGKKIVIVSSGSIVLGRKKLNMVKKPIKLEEKQAAAAVGQIELAQFWKAAFDKYKIRTAQILLAPEDTEQRRKHINARITIQTLLPTSY